jgi:hypothetical protein
LSLFYTALTTHLTYLLVMDRIRHVALLVGHVTSLSVTLSERVSITEVVRTSRLSFFLLQLRILVSRATT